MQGADRSTAPMDTRQAMTRRLYPEVAAGGFTRNDSTVHFYTRVRALTRPDATILDFGAGRGWTATGDDVAFRRRLVDLRDVAGRVVGVDPDPAVLDNPRLHQAHVVTPGQPLPLEDASVDVVIADFVFEHVAAPVQVGREIARVLRPGGWLCARTPNRWGYIGVCARLVPNRLHARMLRRLQPYRAQRDVFPTVYRLNTASALRRAFPGWTGAVLGHTPAPAYFGSSPTANRLVRMVLRTLPERFAPTLLVYLQRP